MNSTAKDVSLKIISRPFFSFRTGGGRGGGGGVGRIPSPLHNFTTLEAMEMRFGRTIVRPKMFPLRSTTVITS